MGGDGTTRSLARHSLRELGLSDEAAQVLLEIRAELDAEYRERFLEMAQALNRQASALERLQSTVQTLVKHVEPSLAAASPAAFRVADGGEEPDLASALVIAQDPIAAGYTLTQADLANALQVTGPDISEFVRAFKLNEDEDCAIMVRRGKRTLYNYRPETARRIREVAEGPPAELNKTQTRVLRRIQRRLGIQY